jgi:hypothetical protein
MHLYEILMSCLKKKLCFMKVGKRCDIMHLFERSGVMPLKAFFMKAGKRCDVMHLYERSYVMLLKKLGFHESMYCKRCDVMPLN